MRAGTVAAFAAALRATGYSVRGVRSAIGSGPAVSLSVADVSAARTRLDRHSPVSALIELFLLGGEVPRAEAETALAPVSIGALSSDGVLGEIGSAVRARIRVLPYEDLLVACDRDPELDGRLEPDHVGGIHASSVLLARITPRRPVESALDVGCGCGFQALLLARHARAVVATDVNPRALEFGRLNAELNGIDNVDWRLGDGLDPVRGERFELVVSNPPYVIAPRPQFAFRESPLPGDAFCERQVADVPAVLTDDGVACLLASWIVAAGEDWAARPTRWTEDGRRGRILLHLETVDAADNAVRWAVPPGGAGSGEAAALIREWLDYYRAGGIGRIAYGAVILHLTPALTRIDLGSPPGPGAGEHIERIIDAHRLLALGSVGTLADAVLTLPAGHRLDWTLRASEGAWQLRRSRLSVEDGLDLGVELDQPTAQLIARLDGRRTVGELLVSLPEDARQSPPLDRLAELLRAGLLGVTRRP